MTDYEIWKTLVEETRDELSRVKRGVYDKPQWELKELLKVLEKW